MGCNNSKAADTVSVENPGKQRDASKAPFHSIYSIIQGPEGKLGSGQFSTVRKATLNGTNKTYAVKIMTKAEMKQEDFDAYEIEKRVMLKLKGHPNLITLEGDYEDSEHYYLVMEMACGGELFHKIVEREVYTEEQARSCIRALVEAIDYCHQRGIVHRDLKPENILLKAPNDETIKIADFGFAKELGTTTDGLLHTACGTPGYVAPEILRQHPYSSEVDIWSLGVIFYILLCGYPPFHADNQRELFSLIKAADFAFDSPDWDEISQEAKDLISKILVADPRKRYTAQQILQHQWLTQSTVNEKNLNRTVANMRQFNARRKLRAAQKAVLTTVRMRMLIGGLKSAASKLSQSEESPSSAQQEQTNNNGSSYRVNDEAATS